MKPDSLTRRDLVLSTSAALAGLATLGAQRAFAESLQHDAFQRHDQPSPQRPAVMAQHPDHLEPAEPHRDYQPVVTPNGRTLEWKLVEGVKVFHLIAEEVEHEFAPGLRARCWGYNGMVHGPTIEAVEGDRVRIYVTNRLPEATSVHWHGLLLPNGMDGVAGLNQPLIQPGETFVYEFTLRQHGTHFYHPHHDEMIQMAMGMMGMFIIHPRGVAPEQRPHRDYAIMLAEWRLDPGTYRPNPLEMTDFNLLTFNGRAFPGTDSLVALLNERVRIRLANGSINNHHPIHLHGYQFKITETDGGQIPESAQWPETTVLTPIGSTRTVEFIANEPGDWALHCHMLHHTMNQMGHEFPNMIGVDVRGLDEQIKPLLPKYMTMGHDGMGNHGEHVEAGHMPVPENSIPMVGGHGPFGYITMGGMFTIMKVRERTDGFNDWFHNPPGTVAWKATVDELHRDGIDVSTAPPPFRSISPHDGAALRR